MALGAAWRCFLFALIAIDHAFVADLVEPDEQFLAASSAVQAHGIGVDEEHWSSEAQHGRDSLSVWVTWSPALHAAPHVRHFFAAAFCFAHRAFCASEIAFRALADIFRRERAA